MFCFATPEEAIKVSISEQSLQIGTTKKYAISTSKFGIGTEEGSYKTPLGSFQISEKFGSGEEIHSIFKARKKVGTWIPDDLDCEEDRIVARILRLSGLSISNSNTYIRYIYIHGTNAEKFIGTPKSHGCVRMNNLDIIELYNRVSLGTMVTIQL